MKRVLIANRGEIAARIARTCARMGIEYVGIYSDADKQSPYLRGAVATVSLGPSLAMESYLRQDKIIAAACKTECDAVHPGYGFLSENAGFAKAVEETGQIFVGPSWKTIAALGDKARAKTLMSAAGVPTVPGTAQASENLDEIAAMAASVGFPVLLKPSAGGGGKGMQVVRERAQVKTAAEQAIRLARANFKDGRLLVERFVENPRHIEVQVFGDHHRNVVHVFERECSLQRRHQKVIEEAPAVSLTPGARDALLEAAVRGAKALGYVNAGTFEFIVSASEEFYFLEVNTRLQVEHPVSEEITGLDFVEWQLRIAAGELIPLRQEEIKASGHAIECRIYAEDAGHDFRPTPGIARVVRWPAKVRVETALESGGEVSPFYDPMVAKVVVHEANRAAALDKAIEAIGNTVILGLTTNLGFLARILADANVRANDIHTRYIDQNLERYRLAAEPEGAIACAAAIELAAQHESPPNWPWSSLSATGILDRVYLMPDAPLGISRFWLGDESCEAGLIGRESTGVTRVKVADRTYRVEGVREGVSLWRGRTDGGSWFALSSSRSIDILFKGERVVLLRYSGRNPSQSANDRTAVAQMPGVVVAILVTVGDRVSAGNTLAVIEAMKMESQIVAPFDGRVEAVHARVGTAVREGELLVAVAPD
jgi:propionyl-CoA carboxylase alpha chain/3-methylcrotonyl-CoA carboxylase alpha subunit